MDDALRDPTVLPTAARRCVPLFVVDLITLSTTVPEPSYASVYWGLIRQNSSFQNIASLISACFCGLSAGKALPGPTSKALIWMRFATSLGMSAVVAMTFFHLPRVRSGMVRGVDKKRSHQGDHRMTVQLCD